MKRDVLLWPMLVLGPFVWFINLEASFAWAPLTCAGHGKGPLYVMTAVSLALTAASGLFFWTRWNERRIFAIGGIALSVLFVLAIVAQAIPTVMMGGCE
jgi:hypothetical protein